MKKKRDKTGLTVVFVIVMALSLLGIGGGGFASLFGGNSGSSSNSPSSPPGKTREVAMSCTLDAYTKFHIHPHLRIIINGSEQAIPANTGISLACMHPIHTHDDTGTIHIESPEERDFTLGDFFAVWGKTFNKDQIIDSRRDAGHEIIMTVDGKPNADYENFVLKDLQQIVIEYRAIKK